MKSLLGLPEHGVDDGHDGVDDGDGGVGVLGVGTGGLRVKLVVDVAERNTVRMGRDSSTKNNYNVLLKHDGGVVKLQKQDAPNKKKNITPAAKIPTLYHYSINNLQIQFCQKL